MRELTAKEIENAPDKYTHYLFDHGRLCYLNNTHKYYPNETLNPNTVRTNGVGAAKPIPRKEFDIMTHEFSDHDVEIDINEDGCLWLCAVAYSSINKRDAIAIAKHFKLTSDDLQ
jgi:hypothetical protein